MHHSNQPLDICLLELPRLEHAIRELRRLPYRPLESLRISRERFCLHPFVQQVPIHDVWKCLLGDIFVEMDGVFSCNPLKAIALEPGRCCCDIRSARENPSPNAILQVFAGYC